MLGDSRSLLWHSRSCHGEGKSLSSGPCDCAWGEGAGEGSDCYQLAVLQRPLNPVPREGTGSILPQTGLEPQVQTQEKSARGVTLSSQTCQPS